MHTKDLTLRQQQLCERSAQLRMAWVHEVQCVKRPLSWGDQLLRGATWIRRKPMLSALAVLLMLAWQPKQAVVWGGRIVWGWRIFQRFRPAGASTSGRF